MKCRKSTKTTPGAPKNDPKTTPKRPKKRSRTTRRQENRTKTISRPSWTPKGPISTVRAHPWGAIWEAKSAPKRNQKRCKNEAKIQESKKPIQDDRGPVLERSWAVLGASWADLDLKIVLSPMAALVFLKNHFFDVKTVRRQLWDQLWPTKAPK